MKKVVKTKSNEGWLMVGLVVMVLLFALAYGIHKNNEAEEENRSLQTRVVNKVQEVRDVKNAVKKLVK